MKIYFICYCILILPIGIVVGKFLKRQSKTDQKTLIVITPKK